MLYVTAHSQRQPVCHDEDELAVCRYPAAVKREWPEILALDRGCGFRPRAVYRRADIPFNAPRRDFEFRRYRRVDVL